MDEDDFDADESEGKGKEDELDPENPEHAFLILERDYNKTFSELEKSPETAKFGDEFSKIFMALFDAHTKNEELTQTVTGLEASLERTKTRLDIAEDVMEKNVHQIDELKHSIDHVCKMADQAHYREQAAQEIIENLRNQVETLSGEIELRNKMAATEDDEDTEKVKAKDNLERERDKLANELNYITQKLETTLVYEQELEQQTANANLKINELEALVEDRTVDINRMKKFRERLELEIETLKDIIDQKDINISENNQEISKREVEISNLEGQIKEHKSSYSKVSKDYVIIEGKYTKASADLEKAIQKHEAVHKELESKLFDLKESERECNKLKNDLTNQKSIREYLQKEIYKCQKDKSGLQDDRQLLRQRISLFEREIDDSKKETLLQMRAVEHMAKEKEILSKAIIRAQAVSKDQLKMIKIQQTIKEKLDHELDNFFVENNKFAKQIAGLAKERDRMAEEHLDMSKKIEDDLEDIRLKKAMIYDLKKTISEQNNKIRQQQNLYEAVRAERASLEKSLEETSAEGDELKKKLKIVFHQTEQLKEDISTKEQLMVKEENIMRKIIKEKENLRIEVNNCVDVIKQLKNDIKSMGDEEKRLHKTIMDQNRKIRQLNKQLEQLMNERDVLGSQLVRRNDELALVNEKIGILEITLHRGEAQYEQRLGDIRLLKIEVKRLRQEKNLMSKSMKNMTDLRQEVLHLERDLTTSRLKCRALEEELQTPINVHRWRKLEGSDPEAFELLQKISHLQKRLLKQSSVAIERERQLKEAEKLYMNLRKVIAQQPGPGLQDEINKTQRALKIKENKLKCAVSELNMAEVKLNEYKAELQRANEELADLKQKYLTEKRANRLKRNANERPRDECRANEVKFTGGGFRMSVTEKSK